MHCGIWGNPKLLWSDIILIYSVISRYSLLGVQGLYFGVLSKEVCLVLVKLSCMPTTLTEDSMSCSRLVKCTKCRYTWLCLLLLEFSIIVNKVLTLFSISRKHLYVNQLPCSHKYQCLWQNSLRVVICWSQQMQKQGSYVICFTELSIS